MFKWVKNINRQSVIRNSFLLPILLVVLISISHVISWYDIGNPFSWAIYLSVAIEIFALASISAASINVSKLSVWLLFGIVTVIQMIGNIFFTFNDIKETDVLFISWIELVRPLFLDWNIVDHRRFLSVIQGGLLPIMSLCALHFYIKFNDTVINTLVENEIETPEIGIGQIHTDLINEQPNINDIDASLINPQNQ